MHLLDIDDSTIRFIAKNYNPLDYNEKLRSLLRFAYPNEQFKNWEKINLHQLINDVIINNYNGEQALKYSLFRSCYKKRAISAFEVNVNNSRVDFLSINGFTNSFEIKSSLDNLYKLKKQATDYISVFEYNYLVIDEKHLESALDIVPKSFGLWSFKNGRKQVHRDAKINKKINPENQLSILNKKELKLAFFDQDGNPKKILTRLKSNEINSRFKLVLKEKYQKRWQFLVKNIELIMPIDVQFFFKTNMNPLDIYH